LEGTNIGTYDAVEHYEEKLKSIEEKLKICEEETEFTENLRTAFVTFYKEGDKLDFVKEFNRRLELYAENPIEDEVMKPEDWELVNAAHPDDYIWENIHENPHLTKWKIIWIEVAIFIVMLFIFTPTAFVALAMGALHSLIGSAATVIALFLPSLLIIVYMEVLIPLVIGKLVKLEKLSRISLEKSSEVEKFVAFYVMLVFGTALIGLSMVAVIIEWDWADWIPTFSSKIVATGGYFSILILQLAFITNGSQFCQFGKLWHGLKNEKLAKTKYDRKRAWALRPFEIGKQYAVSSVVFFICVGYSVILPYILVPGVFFFAIKYYAHRSSIFTCMYIEVNSQGLVSKTVLRAMIIGVCSFWILSGFVFTMTGFTPYTNLGYAFVAIGIAGIAFLLTFEEVVWRLGSNVVNVQKVTKEVEANLIYEGSDLLKKAYVHPIHRVDRKNHRKLLTIEELTAGA
jgi:hypothetical protein